MSSFPLLQRIVLVLCLLPLLTSCGGDQRELAELRREVTELRTANAALLQRVDELEKARQAAGTELDAAGKPALAGKDIARLNEPGSSPRLGNEEAPVTVVVFADFQCPYCKSSAGLPRSLVERFPDDVRVVFKNYPLGRHYPAAYLAAKAGWAAQQQGKFWELYDLIYAGDLTQLSPEVVRGYAVQLGLDMERFDRDSAAQGANWAIIADKKLARRIKAGGTPSYWVNGRRASANPAAIEQLVTEEIAKRRATASPTAGG